MCKHVIGCAARNKLVKIPNEVKDNVMERKRGRQWNVMEQTDVHTRKALEFQPPDQVETRSKNKSKATANVVDDEKKKPSVPETSAAIEATTS